MNIAKIIEEIKSNRKDTLSKYVGNIIPFLEELKEYEIPFNEELLAKMLKESKIYSTKNCGFNCSNDMKIVEYGTKESDFVALAVDIDCEGNFTDWVICEMDYKHHIYELDAVYQRNKLDKGYAVAIDIMAEGYDILDKDGCRVRCERNAFSSVIPPYAEFD